MAVIIAILVTSQNDCGLEVLLKLQVLVMFNFGKNYKFKKIE